MLNQFPRRRLENPNSSEPTCEFSRRLRDNSEAAKPHLLNRIGEDTASLTGTSCMQEAALTGAFCI